jgi:hypothetical protein
MSKLDVAVGINNNNLRFWVFFGYYLLERFVQTVLVPGLPDRITGQHCVVEVL